MTSEPDSILVIEDEPDLREGLRHNLELDGYRVAVAGTGTEGLAKATTAAYSLIILDLMLPELSGLDVLRRLRDGGNGTPVIILSAKGQDHDKVSGLERGADDYVTKPFGLAELMARIRAVLRRTAGGANGQQIHEFPGLVVDFKRFTVKRDREEFQLSRYEAEILRMLIDHQGEVVTRNDDLLRTVWGYVHLPTTRTVDNHIARLRKKIERSPDSPEFVVTVHGIGYRFEPKGRSGAAPR
jgi:DNA-binding response OmpR family regulator